MGKCAECSYNKNLFAFYEDDNISVKIDYETESIDPLELIGDPFCEMAFFHKRYSLGTLDRDTQRDGPESYLVSLILKTVPEEDIVKFIKNRKGCNYLQIIYNRGEKLYQLEAYGEYSDRWYTEYTYSIADSGYLTSLAESILENLKMPELIGLAEKENIVVPVYLYDHSGITISTSPFGCRWDSGQLGWVVVTKKAIIDNYGSYSKANAEKARDLLEKEIRIYDRYLTEPLFYIECTDLGSANRETCGFVFQEDFEDVLKDLVPKEYQNAIPEILKEAS